MKIIICLHFVFLIFKLSSQAQELESKQDAGNVIVTVTGLKNDRGGVIISLFDSKESYDGKTQRYTGATVKIDNNKAQWKGERIPFGDYAIKAFHDENSNGKIDTNFLGIPTESYGFSNNAKGLLGPPSFDKAKFHFNQIEMKIEIAFRRIYS